MTTTLLLSASIDGAIAAAVVWLICRLVPSLPAGARAMLWWCAAAKFIVALAWTTPLALPVLPAVERSAPALPAGDGTVAAVAPGAGNSPAEPAMFEGGGTPFSWPQALLLMWAAGVAASLIAGLAQWRRARAILRDAAAAPPELDVVIADIAARAGLPQPPPACVSTRVATPLVVGLRRSTIVLPAATIATLTPAEQRMAISHEIAHIRRGDLRWGCVPALAEALFFFHPLAHVCAREYALWREAACDAAVIETTGAAPADYAQLLVGLGVTRPRAGLAVAGASESFSNLKRRLIMLNAPSSTSTSSRVVAGAIVGLAALAIVPVQLTARAAPAQQTVISTIATPEWPKPVAFETAVWQEREQRDREATYDWRLRSRQGQPTFVIFRDDATHLMDGSLADLKHAEQFRKGKEELIWVRQDGREYISRDATLLRQLRELWLPVSRLGEQQSRLGEAQSEIGERQSELGVQQSRLGTEQSKLGMQQSEIGVRQSQLSQESRRKSEAESQRYEQERVKLQAQIEALNAQLEELNRKMRELAQPMDDLGAQMEQRGREMERLGAQMEDASARAERGMRELITSAIASGVLQPVK